MRQLFHDSPDLNNHTLREFPKLLNDWENAPVIYRNWTFMFLPCLRMSLIYMSRVPKPWLKQAKLQLNMSKKSADFGANC